MGELMDDSKCCDVWCLSNYTHRLRPGPKVIKLFFMLNSAEHEILNAHKYKKYQEIELFTGSDKPIVLFSWLINVKMPTIVGILTFMSRKKFSCSAELSMKIL